MTISGNYQNSNCEPISNYTIKFIRNACAYINCADSENSIANLIIEINCDTDDKQTELYETAIILFEKYNCQTAKKIMKYLDSPLTAAEHTARYNKYAEEVYAKYNRKCIITGRVGKRCQAAHILGHAECTTNYERYDVNNGIVLDAGIHICWDDNTATAIAVPDEVNNIITFRANPKLSKDEILEQVPELLEPKIINITNPMTMKYFRLRYELDIAKIQNKSN